MSQAPRQSRGLHPIRAAASVLRMGGSTLMRLDPDGLRYVATILVWAHWFVVAFSFVQLAYRPAGWPERYLPYAPLSLPQRPGEGRYEVASTGPPAVRCHLTGLRRRFTPGLGWVLE